MIITTHAKNRYVKRIRSGADSREAAIVLADAATRAVLCPERTARGHALWLVDNPAMRLVTKHDPACGIVCVTVLLPEEPWEEIEEEPRALLPPPPRETRDAVEARQRQQRIDAATEAKRARAQQNAAKALAQTAAAAARRLKKKQDYEARVKAEQEAAAACRAQHPQGPKPPCSREAAARVVATQSILAATERRRRLGLPTKSERRRLAKMVCVADGCLNPPSHGSVWRRADGCALCAACNLHFDVVMAELGS